MNDEVKTEKKSKFGAAVKPEKAPAEPRPISILYKMENGRPVVVLASRNASKILGAFRQAKVEGVELDSLEVIVD